MTRGAKILEKCKYYFVEVGEFNTETTVELYDAIEAIDKSDKEIFDCIINLMAIVDTPIGRKKFNDEFSNEARNNAREILKKYINNK